MRRQLVNADRLAARIAANQHGVASFAQLRCAGLTEAAIRRRVAAGRLFRVHRGIYAVGHPGLSDRARWMAATLACGEGCALSHRSAAELWSMVKAGGGQAHVTVPIAGGRARRRGIRIHRSPALAPGMITRRDNIPVTRPPRTLEDLRRTVGPGEVRAALREAELRGLPLDGFELPDGRATSDGELLFLRICRQHRLPEPEVNTRLDRFRVDFLWREQRLVVEIDGYRYHRGSVAFHEDRERDNKLTALGFEVVRFSYRRLNEEPQAVAVLVRARLERRR